MTLVTLALLVAVPSLAVAQPEPAPHRGRSITMRFEAAVRDYAGSAPLIPATALCRAQLE